MPEFTTNQWAILFLVLVLGWLLGLISRSGGKKWKRAYEAERDARIEELLVTGLDHYFSEQHELAINVWTRVLFIDRGHARARAYIERVSP